MPVDKSSDRVRRMFARIAWRYDALNCILSFGIDRYWRWRTVQIVPPSGSLPILDVCTGTGDLAFAYCAVCVGQGHSAPIIGADFCHEMLEIARQKAHRVGAESHINFIEADAQALPVPSNAFQIVCVAFGLRNVADTDRGLAEMTRACAPGGHVAVLEFSTPTWQPFKAIYGWYFRNVLPRIGQFFARDSAGAYDYLPTSVGEFPQGEALIERMRAAGLTNLRRYPLTFGVATLYVGRKPVNS